MSATTTTVNGLSVITPPPTSTGGVFLNNNFTAIGSRLNSLENPPAIIQTSGIQGPSNAQVLLTNNEDITSVIVQGFNDTECSLQVNGILACQAVNIGAGNLVIEGGNLVVNGHIGNAAATPTLAAANGAGTTGTVTNSGSDLVGSITMTASGTITTNTVVAVLTFATPYNNASIAMLSPGNLTAANYIGAYVTSSTTGVALHSGTTTFLTGQSYVWNYATFGT
jgi:hypothetical protein